MGRRTRNGGGALERRTASFDHLALVYGIRQWGTLKIKLTYAIRTLDNIVKYQSHGFID